jgi:ribosomal protein S18 acetylase RimI-like enzyme
MEGNIETFEAISINAIPATRIVFYHGWILQLDKGYKDRANCVYPLHASDMLLKDLVHYCENLYSSYHLPPLFKVTSNSQPPDLDSYLDSIGYSKYNETSFQIQMLPNHSGKPISDNYYVSENLSEQWSKSYFIWNNTPPERQSIVKDIWNRISIKLYFCQLIDQEQTACVGFMVQLHDTCGIFGVTVDPNKRCEGHGTRFMNNLLIFASKNGGKLCYLQVEISNRPALKLYANLGFKEQYRYWYRKKMD